MKKTLTLSFMAIMMIVMMASCTKESLFTYDPIDYVSIPRAEYKIQNNVATAVRFSISNQSNKTLYYCKFRVTEKNENGVAYYSDTYEVGSKDNMSAWSLSPGDINFTDYYSVHFVYQDGGSISGEIIDALFY